MIYLNEIPDLEMCVRAACLEALFHEPKAPLNGQALYRFTGITLDRCAAEIILMLLAELRERLTTDSSQLWVRG